MKEGDIKTLFHECVKWYFFNRIAPQYNPNVIYVHEVTQCLKKSYFNRKMPIEPITSKMVILTIGELIHKLFQDYLEKKGFKFEVECRYPLENQLTLIGHADAMNSDCIIEIKSVKKIPSSPLEHHVLQLNAYMYMANREKGYIIYIDKINGGFEVFECRRDYRKFGKIVERAYQLHEALLKGNPPNEETSWLCNYCEYRIICKSEWL